MTYIFRIVPFRKESTHQILEHTGRTHAWPKLQSTTTRRGGGSSYQKLGKPKRHVLPATVTNSSSFFYYVSRYQLKKTLRRGSDSNLPLVYSDARNQLGAFPVHNFAPFTKTLKGTGQEEGGGGRGGYVVSKQFFYSHSRDVVLPSDHLPTGKAFFFWRCKRPPGRV